MSAVTRNAYLVLVAGTTIGAVLNAQLGHDALALVVGAVAIWLLIQWAIAEIKAVIA